MKRRNAASDPWIASRIAVLLDAIERAGGEAALTLILCRLMGVDQLIAPPLEAAAFSRPEALDTITAAARAALVEIVARPIEFTNHSGMELAVRFPPASPAARRIAAELEAKREEYAEGARGWHDWVASLPPEHPMAQRLDGTRSKVRAVLCPRCGGGPHRVCGVKGGDPAAHGQAVRAGMIRARERARAAANVAKGAPVQLARPPVAPR